MRYLQLKHDIAHILQKAATSSGLPLRSLLSCVSTKKDRIIFNTEAARKHGFKESDVIKGKLEIDIRWLISEVLSESTVPRFYKSLIPAERVCVDFSSPNLAKPFHVGHLNSTILGNYISNLKAYLGDHVVRINYLGDWGTQFGILSAAFRKFGDEDKLKKDPLNHLLQVYVEGNKLAENDPEFRQYAQENFAKLESGDESMREMWWNFRDISLKEYFKIYSKLGIKFDIIQGESAYHKPAMELIRKLRENGTLIKSNGLEGIQPLPEHFVPLVKSNGSTLYITRDICAATARRKELEASSLYYVVDNSQTKHFQDLQYCLDKLGYSDLNIVHVKFGKIRGLSTRKGQVVLLDDLIAEAKFRATRQMEQADTTRVSNEEFERTSMDLALAAIYVNTMKGRRQRDSDFDWESSFALKGASGISLQYCHARLCSLLKVNSSLEPRFHESCLPDLIVDVNIRNAILHLVEFEEVLLRSDVSAEPCELVQYLFKLNSIVNAMNKTARVKGETVPIAESRLLIFKLLRDVLGQSLRLLGVKPLEQM